MSLKLTYASMFNPPAELHQKFDAAMQSVSSQLGRVHALHLAGDDHAGAHNEPRYSPIDQRILLGQFALAGADDVERAMAAAQAAFPRWRASAFDERLRLLRRAADIVEQRLLEIAAVLTLEVGKNRMESLGEVQETADFFRHYADDFESHRGFEHALPDDPLPGWRSRNRSVMRPHGVWLVIAPFNFPLALAAGPVAAALVTGNTVVFKTARDTPWSGRLLAECLRDAGFPAGVFNYINGDGSDVGAALVRDPRTAGVTFTGSYEVGMAIYRAMAGGAYARPCIAEMGGKNPCIVTAHADLERAALGIVRSAYGLSGQKCSALSRIYVQHEVADALIERLLAQIGAIQVGDPRIRENWMGPLTTAAALRNYIRDVPMLSASGARLLAGGERLQGEAHEHGYFVAPTLAEAPAQHPLMARELFLPIAMLCRVADFDQAIALCNASSQGLAAGCYGSEAEVAQFFDRIEAGVLYGNRPQGATTGAWPGYQPFGGWKGSSTTGKAIASFHYLAQYMREQSRTLVD